jgi:hypothetical protein
MFNNIKEFIKILFVDSNNIDYTKAVEKYKRIQRIKAIRKNKKILKIQSINGVFKIEYYHRNTGAVLDRILIKGDYNNIVYMFIDYSNIKSAQELKNILNEFKDYSINYFKNKLVNC